MMLSSNPPIQLCSELKFFLDVDLFAVFIWNIFRLEQQVLDRFEKENGGQLLVGALCLLEVSQRGLLEAELLTILGDEDNLMPPSQSEKYNSEEKGMVLATTIC